MTINALSHVTDALRNLKLRGQRTYLAVAGIAVGCASVVALLNIAHNAALESMRAFEGMGTTTLIAQFPNSQNQKPVSAEISFEDRTLRLISIAALAPVSQYSMQIKHAGKIIDATITGTTGSILNILGGKIDLGRGINNFDFRETYAVVGNKIALEMNVKLGERLQIGSYLYTVIGILGSKASSGLVPIALDDSILIPIEGMRRIKTNPELNFIVATGASVNRLDESARELLDVTKKLTHRQDVIVRIPVELLEGIARQNRTFTYLLSAISVVSLLVGGAGVMNVMLMNVSERRKEIGLRIALGARRKDIRNLFLIEALMLSAIGAVTGAIIGLTTGYGFALLSEWSFDLSFISLPLGLCCALGTGIFFGLHPAIAASKLRPVEALRDD